MTRLRIAFLKRQACWGLEVLTFALFSVCLNLSGYVIKVWAVVSMFLVFYFQQVWIVSSIKCPFCCERVPWLKVGVQGQWALWTGHGEIRCPRCKTGLL